MRILKANNYPTFNQLPNLVVDTIDLNDIELTTGMKWLMKRYKPFEDSCSKVGMLYPITYTDYDHYWEPMRTNRWPTLWDKFVVHNGNKRVYYAKKHGYTHIEGWFVPNKETKDIIVRHTYIPKERFPQ